jgi:hypothetical protein
MQAWAERFEGPYGPYPPEGRRIRNKHHLQRCRTAAPARWNASPLHSVPRHSFREPGPFPSVSILMVSHVSSKYIDKNDAGDANSELGAVTVTADRVGRGRNLSNWAPFASGQPGACVHAPFRTSNKTHTTRTDTLITHTTVLGTLPLPPSGTPASCSHRPRLRERMHSRQQAASSARSRATRQQPVSGWNTGAATSCPPDGLASRRGWMADGDGRKRGTEPDRRGQSPKRQAGRQADDESAASEAGRGWRARLRFAPRALGAREQRKSRGCTTRSRMASLAVQPPA